MITMKDTKRVDANTDGFSNEYDFTLLGGMISPPLHHPALARRLWEDVGMLDPEALISRLNDLLLPAIEPLCHISRIDNQQSMFDDPWVIDLTVIRDNDDGVHAAE